MPDSPPTYAGPIIHNNVLGNEVVHTPFVMQANKVGLDSATKRIDRLISLNGSNANAESIAKSYMGAGSTEAPGMNVSDVQIEEVFAGWMTLSLTYRGFGDNDATRLIGQTTTRATQMLQFPLEIGGVAYAFKPRNGTLRNPATNNYWRWTVPVTTTTIERTGITRTAIGALLTMPQSSPAPTITPLAGDYIDISGVVEPAIAAKSGTMLFNSVVTNVEIVGPHAYHTWVETWGYVPAQWI